MKLEEHDLYHFCRFFYQHFTMVREILIGLLVLLMLLGMLFARWEELPMGDGVYFSYITGLTIGYGDIVPKTALGSLLSVVIGLVGVLFTGMTVAVASRALADTANLRHPNYFPMGTSPQDPAPSNSQKANEKETSANEPKPLDD